jgi:hypothetical protein
MDPLKELLEKVDVYATFPRYKKLWPTPCSHDAYMSQSTVKGTHLDLLPCVVALEVKTRLKSRHHQLNPTWVEWLMGYPKDFTIAYASK